MNKLFEQGEELLDVGQFQEAFTEDEAMDAFIRAEALNMMGAIVWHMAPELARENELVEGLNYFRKAITLDENNLGVLLNIMEGFGASYGQHQDFDLLRFAYQQLKKLEHKLSDTDIVLIENKHKLLFDLENQK